MSDEKKGRVLAIGGERLEDAHAKLDEWISAGVTGLVIASVGKHEDSVTLRLYGNGSAASLMLISSLLEHNGLSLFDELLENDDE